MKKIIKLFVIIAVLGLIVPGCESNMNTSQEVNSMPQVEFTTSNTEPQKEKIKIYVSNYPLYDITKNIVGEEADVINVMQNNTTSHNWEPSTHDVIELSKTDVFIYTGTQMESWAGTLISDGTITGKIIDASQGVESLSYDHDHEEHVNDHKHEEHEDEHSDHSHGEYDPHIWLSLRNAEIISENIKNVLQGVDPDNADKYEENYQEFSNKLKELDNKYSTEFKNAKNKYIVVSHEAYGYLCRDYDFNQIGIEGINAAGEPSVQQINEIINTIKDKNIKTIFYENTINPKVANLIATEAGAKTIMLSPLESLSNEQEMNKEDYLSIMQDNLDKILEALNE